MRAICLLLCLAFPVLARGESPGSMAEPPFKVSGAFFALSVADLEGSAKWYAEKLGMKVVMKVPKTDGTAVTVLEGGGLIVELMQHDKALALGKAAPGVTGTDYVHGIFKAGIVVEDLERTLGALKARGVEIAYGPYPARGSQRANAIVRDNSGNLLQLFGK